MTNFEAYTFCIAMILPFTLYSLYLDYRELKNKDTKNRNAEELIRIEIELRSSYNSI